MAIYINIQNAKYKITIRRVRRVKKQTSVNKIRKSKYKSAVVKHMETLIKSSDKKKIKEYFPKFQSMSIQIISKITEIRLLNYNSCQAKKLRLEKFQKFQKKI